MKVRMKNALGAAMLFACGLAVPASAQDRSGILPAPPVTDNGSVTVPDFDLPFSSFASREAQESFVRRLRNPMPIVADIGKTRQISNEKLRPSLEAWAARYPYSSTQSKVGNVPIETFVPAAGIAPENRDRVLIQLHGGGFVTGGGGPGGALESIPIAGLGRIKVVAVDYRLQPENTMQDAIDDAVAVYQDLLRTHRPENIGIYGCSAGGSLSALATTAIIRRNLPVPGAIGVFCASLRGFSGGDSGQLWPRLGSVIRMAPPPPPAEGAAPPADPFAPTEQDMRQFPPTLFLTGTRAPEMSGAAQSNLELRSLGVTSELLLFDGLDHGFYSEPSLPESARANSLIVRFFADHLGRPRAGSRRTASN